MHDDTATGRARRAGEQGDGLGRAHGTRSAPGRRRVGKALLKLSDVDARGLAGLAAGRRQASRREAAAARCALG